MSRCGLAFALLLCACTDRGLDAAGIDTTLVSQDLAGRDLTGVDLAGVDFAKPIVPGDTDLAMTTGDVGVPCGSATCSSGEACCVSFSGAMCKMGGGMMMGGVCGQMAASYRCDGPEDCMSGQRCVAQDGGFGGGGGTIFGTRCRGMMSGGMGSVVCHTSADCPNNQTCSPAQSIPGGPPLSTCG